MLFSSITFLYLFLPLVLITYFAVPKRFKNFTLLIFSLIFYAWGEPKYLLLMIASIIIAYIFGLIIEKYREFRDAKVYCAVSVIISLIFLFYFKYVDFFIENINAVTNLSVPFLKVTLPIGISFYTFQIISYTIDVYRGEPAQKNFLNLALYISMFPQLIAGPIVRYNQIAPQLKDRVHTFEKAASGIRRFSIGFAKKILIANSLGELCNIFTQTNQKTVLFYWVYAVSCSLQIYFDFSGYSDMAIGLGRILGFEFSENFNFPFISASVSEFWRRWHISLGTWFRDYVYIPLGGNRVSKVKHIFNIALVWMLTGFWHGAQWNFVIWGLYFALLLIAEKFLLGKILRRYKVLSHIYVIFAILISFVIFNSTDISILGNLSGLFGVQKIAFSNPVTLYYLKSYATLIIISVLGATPLALKLWCQINRRIKNNIFLTIIETAVCLVLLVVCTAYLADGSFNPFLYFRF